MTRTAACTFALTIVLLTVVGCARDAALPVSPHPPASSERTVTPPPAVAPEPTPAPAPEPEPPDSTPPAVPKPVPKPPDEVSAPSDNKTRAWYYVPNTEHEPPGVAPGAKSLLADYNGRY